MQFPDPVQSTSHRKTDPRRDNPRKRSVSKGSTLSTSPRKIIEESGNQIAQSTSLNPSPKETALENRAHPPRRSSDHSRSPTSIIEEFGSQLVLGSLGHSPPRNVIVDSRAHLPRKSSDHSRSPGALSVETPLSSPRKKSPRRSELSSDTSDSAERIIRLSQGRNNHHVLDPAAPSILIDEVKSFRDQSPRKLNFDSITHNTRRTFAEIRIYIIGELLQLQNSFDTLTDSISTHEHSFDINSEHPNSIFLMAVNQGIFEYMNEKGKLCAIEDLIKLVAEKADDNFPKRSLIIKNRLDEHKHKQALHAKKLSAQIANGDIELATTHCMLMDPAILGMKESAKQYIDLLLNIEPLASKDDSINDSETPNVPLITALHIYKDYVTSEEFFDILALLIRSSRVSYLHKMRYLILCRMWLDFKMCNEVKNLTHYTNSFDEIFKACEHIYEVDFSPESLAVRNLCDELKIDFSESIDSKSIYDNSLPNGNIIRVHKYISNYLISTENINPSEFIEKLTTDLTIEVALIIITLNPANFICSKKMELHKEIANYTNNLSQFVKNLALQISGVQMKSRFITLFVSIIFQLIKKRDFLNALAIYSPINSLFSDILMKSDQKTEPKHPMERIELSSVTYANFELIRNLFHPSNFFKKVREEIAKCQWQRIFYIPNLLTLGTFAEYGMANINKEKNLADNNHKFRFHESLLIEQIYEMGIKDVKFHLRKRTEKHILNTDIGYFTHVNRT